MIEFLVIVQGTGKKIDQTAEAIQERVKAYQAWADSIGSNYVSGQRLEKEGRHISSQGEKKSVRSDGPYLETKELVAGFILIKADNFEHATSLIDSCPLLEYWDLIIRKIVT